MIPEGRLSTTPVVADFLSADNLPRSKLQDFEQGGVAIGDPTQGLDVQTWELRVLGGDVRLRPYPDGPYTTFFRDTQIEEITFAFDTNMQPVFAYRSGGVCKLRWFDPTPANNKFVTTSFPGIRDIRACLDDKRATRRDFSDILIFYLKDPPEQQPQSLYMRLQRDRYEIEYNAGPLPVGTSTLDRVGMAANWRVRIGLFGLFNKDVTQPRREIPPFPPDVPTTTGLFLNFNKAQNPYTPDAAWQWPRFRFELYKPPASDAYP